MELAHVGVDVGGTKIAGALLDDDLNLLHWDVFATPRSEHGADPGAQVTMTMLQQLCDLAESKSRQVRAVGIGIPDYISPSGSLSSHIVVAPDFEVRKTLEGGVSALLESDVRCAALAEQRLGSGRGLPSFCYVTIGTGISYAFVSRGHIWAGHRGEAIALGEMPIAYGEELITDAAPTLELQASGLAIERALVAKPSTLGVATNDRARLEEEIHTKAGRFIGHALATLVCLLDPAAVVIGGGLGLSGGVFGDSLRRHYRDSVRVRPAPPPLLRANLGESAGAIGAALVAKESLQA